MLFLSHRVGSLSDVCCPCFLWSFIGLNDSLFPFLMPHPLPWKLSSICAWNSWVSQSRTYDNEDVRQLRTLHTTNNVQSPRHLIICCPLWPSVTFHTLLNDISVPLSLIGYTWMAQTLMHMHIQIELTAKFFLCVFFPLHSLLYSDSFVFYRSDHLYCKVPCKHIVRTNMVKLFSWKKEIKLDSIVAMMLVFIFNTALTHR